jgi:hypothetical protein
MFLPARVIDQWRLFAAGVFKILFLQSSPHGGNLLAHFSNSNADSREGREPMRGGVLRVSVRASEEKVEIVTSASLLCQAPRIA